MIEIFLDSRSQLLGQGFVLRLVGCFEINKAGLVVIVVTADHRIREAARVNTGLDLLK